MYYLLFFLFFIFTNLLFVFLFVRKDYKDNKTIVLVIIIILNVKK